MALLVWLPLNGNLKNQGLSPVTTSVTSGVINSAGKIGSCYGCKSGAYLAFNYTITTTNNFTIAFWMKMPSSMQSTGSWHTLFYFSGNDAGTNRTIPISWTDYNNVKIWDTSNHQSCWMEINYDEWIHYTITNSFSNNINYLTVYKNGVLVGKYEKSAELKIQSGTIALGPNVGTSYGPVYYNDVRIYDHCLSPKEVKEISKGLVIHYKFDSDYIEGTINLCSNTRSGWNNSGTCNRDYDNSTIPNRPTPEYVYATTATSDGNMAVTFGYTSSNLPSKTIIASTYCWLEGPLDSSTVYVRSSKTDGSVGLLYYNGDSNPNNWPKGQWIRISSNAIATASDATTFYICTYINRNNEVRAFNGWLIEEKNHITPWVAPGKSRAKSTTIYDCSGYAHDGTIVGDIIMNDNSPRYLKYTNFPDSACSIGIGNLSTLVPEGIFTFNIWLRKNTNEWSSKGYETILGGPGGFELEAKRGGTNSPEIVLYNWGSGGTAYNLDVWNMVTFVRTASDTKLYLNGVLKVTGSAGSIPSGNYFIGSWSSATQLNFRGYLSDARLYVTALSEDDIKELYNTSSFICNNGTLESYKFKEFGSSVEINKNGISSASYVSEYADSFIILDDGSVWVKLLHHNNPASYLFTSNNCWNNNEPNLFSALGLLKSEGWANKSGEYEFLVKEKATSSSTEVTYRWKQTSNPALSSTATGYTVLSGSPPRSCALLNNGLCGCFHNGNAWWCCCGSYAAYNGGIPGFNGVVTTGYVDLYIRVPDIKMKKEDKNIFHENGIQSNQLIEI